MGVVLMGADHERDWEARWAERDRRREQTEAYFARQRAEHEAEYVRVVSNALHAESDHGRDGAPLELTGGRRGICNCVHKATVAVTALQKAGYVFATIGSWDDDD